MIAVAAQSRCGLGLALALLLLACHGLGRELVGVEPGADKIGNSCEARVPICADLPLPATPTDLPPSAAALDLTECNRDLGATCMVIAGEPVSGESGSLVCESELPIAAGETTSAVLQDVHCGALHVVVNDGQQATQLSLQDASLEQANIRIESAAPLTLELQAAHLSQVWFELHGPITLHVVEPRVFRDVRVSGASPAAAQARLVLDKVNGRELAVGDESEGFAGEVSFWHSIVSKVRIKADFVSLESSVMFDSSVDVSRFEASDATLTRLQLSAERSLIAASSVEHFELHDCRAFSAIEGTFRSSRVNGCEEPARLYGTRFSTGVLDGPLDLDSATLTQVRVGLHTSGAITAWDSGLAYVRFCDSARSIVFGGTSTADCTHCAKPTAVGGLAACVVDPMQVVDMFATEERCAAFIEPPECQAPAPMRLRPTGN